MNDLTLHCGAQKVLLSDLSKVPLPKETRTYKPVSHFDLVANTTSMGDMFLQNQGYELESQNYALGRKGKHMFFNLNYKKLTTVGKENTGLTIGGRNSYDKSTTIGIAVGMRVFICDNLAFSGDQVTYLRKHTGNVYEDLEVILMRTMKNADTEFKRMDLESQAMKEVSLTNNDAYRNLGVLFGNNILTSRQLPVACNEWKKPQHDAFKERNMWSFYNACTEALKSSPPKDMLTRHVKLHKTLCGRGGAGLVASA